jgi:hypothetical protein
VAGAEVMRLRNALEDYIGAQTGGSGRTRSAQTGGDTVELAQQLLASLGSGGTQDDSPGRRAAGGRGFSGAAGRALAALSGGGASGGGV